MRKKLTALLSHNFLKSVGILIGGTAFAQALTILALPLLTRLYTPEEFSVFAVYASIVGIISVAACLRIDIAIPLPEKDEDAANLLATALVSSAAISGIIMGIVLLFPEKIITLINQDNLQPYLFLLPLGIWVASSFSALQLWASRKKKFKTIAKVKIKQTGGGLLTQVSCGWLGITPLGLILGHIIISGAGIFNLAKDTLKHDRSALKSISLADMKRTLRDHKNYPKYSVLESLANSGSIQLPIIIISAISFGPDAGFLMLASRVMLAPLTLIGGAVSQVYLSCAPQELRSGTLSQFTANIINGLIRSGVGPIIFAGILLPIFFPLIFGKSWQRAGDLILWMTPWFVMQLLVSPISMTLHVVQKQGIALALQISGFILRVGAVAACAQLAPHWTGETYAISGFIFYFTYFCIVISAANIKINNFLKSLKINILIVMLWISLAITIRASYTYLIQT